MSGRHREKSRETREVEDAVASSQSVVIRGSGSRSSRLPDADARAASLSVPSGIIRVDPGEMVVECFAGTPTSDLQRVLAGVGQRVNLPLGGTVGGALATSHNSIHRLGRGAVRDAVLRLDVVGADARGYRCGGDTVKNVSGFDLCRMHVGAYGTLGIIVTVLLRTYPLPRCSRWTMTSHAVATTLVPRQWGVTSALSNGTDAYVHLEGHPRDLDAVQERWSMVEVEAIPTLGEFRWSVNPATLDAALAPNIFGEIGVGVVHHHSPQPRRLIDAVTRALNGRIRDQFDPERRLNPHLDVLEVVR